MIVCDTPIRSESAPINECRISGSKWIWNAMHIYKNDDQLLEQTKEDTCNLWVK